MALNDSCQQNWLMPVSVALINLLSTKSLLMWLMNIHSSNDLHSSSSKIDKETTYSGVLPTSARLKSSVTSSSLRLDSQ